MFGTCIWADFFLRINRDLSQHCKSQIHNPHITLDYNVYQSSNKNFHSL